MSHPSHISPIVFSILRLVFFYGLWMLVPLISFIDSAGAQELSRFHVESVQMGGPWGITLYAATEDEAKSACNLAFRRVAEINQLFSDYSDTSESQLIAAKYQVDQPITVSDEFFALTRTSLDFSQASEGAFDITVGPLTQLWRRAYRKKQFPAPEIWDAAHQKIGYQHLKINPCEKTITFSKPGMKLDFGAIAKGYAADQALMVLNQQGYKSALVDGNGNYAAGDPPPGKEYWGIEFLQLQPKTEHNKNIPAEVKQIVRLKNQGISTSGDFAQSITIDGQRYSHIIDPLTGKPQNDQRLITIIAKNAMTADALSTILCIKGEEFLKTMQEQHPEIQAYGAVLVNDNLTTFTTPGWSDLLIK